MKNAIYTSKVQGSTLKNIFNTNGVVWAVIRRENGKFSAVNAEGQPIGRTIWCRMYDAVSIGKAYANHVSKLTVC